MKYNLFSKSLQNFTTSLLYRNFRDSEGLFIIEGIKLSQEFLDSNYQAAYIIIEENIENKNLNKIKILAEEISDTKKIPIYSTTSNNFKKISSHESPEGILIVAEKPENKTLPNSDLIVLLDSINDPGNLGTIIRTADWFGFNSFILINNCADLYNPKTIRATMGGIFRGFFEESDDPVLFIRNRYSDYNILGASLDATINISEVNKSDKIILVLGSESHGISDEIKPILTQSFKIPSSIKSKSESLNVANAAAICFYEFSK